MQRRYIPHILARWIAALGKGQQVANGIDAKSQLAGTADKLQPPHMGVMIIAMTTAGTRRRMKQLDPLVIANGLDIDAGSAR